MSTSDPRTPLEYLHGLEPDQLPPVNDENQPQQPSKILAVRDEETGLTSVFLGFDPSLMPDPAAASAMLDPDTPVYQVVVGWNTLLDGVDADASSLHFEVHWRFGPGESWHTVRLGIDALADDDFTMPALLEATAGAPVILTSHEKLDALFDGSSPEQVTVLPRAPLTALAGYLLVVASSKLDSSGLERRPDPPGRMATSQFAQLPSMRLAERNSRKLALAELSIRLDRRAFAPFLLHQKWAAREAQRHFASAQPIVISHQLLAALPDFPDRSQAVAFASRAPLPLPVMYLDCTDGRGTPASITAYTDNGRARQAAPLPLFGALMWRDEGKLHAVPFGRDTAQGPSCEPLMHLVIGDEVEFHKGVSLSPNDVFAAPTNYVPKEEGTQIGRSLGAQGRMIGELLASALMLTNAARVEVAPRELSSKQAKQARKRKQAAGWEIVVRMPPSTATAAPDESGKRRFANPFWRRGTFAAYPVGTKMADAADREDLVWIPWKDALCRLVWHPPTIVGAGQANSPTVARRVRRWPVGRASWPQDRPS